MHEWEECQVSTRYVTRSRWRERVSCRRRVSDCGDFNKILIINIDRELLQKCIWMEQMGSMIELSKQGSILRLNRCFNCRINYVNLSLNCILNHRQVDKQFLLSFASFSIFEQNLQSQTFPTYCDYQYHQSQPMNETPVADNSQPIIDLRSDVLTKVPQAMLQAMSQAELRNDSDMFSLDDVAAVRFQKKFAEMFGKEAAIIFPTASMSNIAAVILHTQPGSEVIISSSSHAIERESASFAVLAGVQTRQIITNTGLFSTQEVKERIRKEVDHITFPDTDLIFLENATFRGRVWQVEDLRAIKKLAQQKKVKVHIDGARIFSAFAYLNIDPKEISDCYDTMSICLSKGLCCPMGAVILGSKAEVTKLKHLRKGLGGGLWHTGLIAAAAEYALEHTLSEVKRDNQMAALLAIELSTIEGIVAMPEQTEINMVHWSVEDKDFDHKIFRQYLLESGIRIKPFDEDTNDYRFVIYSGIREKQIEKVVLTIRAYFATP